MNWPCESKQLLHVAEESPSFVLQLTSKTHQTAHFDALRGKATAKRILTGDGQDHLGTPACPSHLKRQFYLSEPVTR